jgi:hypothetical protein
MDSLEDKVRKARERAMAAQKSGGGSDNWWKPQPGKESHIRVLERPGYDECWIEYNVHYIDKPGGGVKVVRCGGESGCYSCDKVADLRAAGTKEDLEVARRSRSQEKNVMQLIDWDDRERGPLFWEPKNTQNCAMWTNFLTLIMNPEYRKKVYNFKEGILLTLLVDSTKKKIGNREVNQMNLKSFLPGNREFPVVAGKLRDGSYAIQLQLKSGEKKIFKLLDLDSLATPYSEAEHMEAWGEEVLDQFDEGGSSVDSSGTFEEITGSEHQGLEYNDGDLGSGDLGSDNSAIYSGADGGTAEFEPDGGFADPQPQPQTRRPAPQRQSPPARQAPAQRSRAGRK